MGRRGFFMPEVGVAQRHRRRRTCCVIAQHVLATRFYGLENTLFLGLEKFGTVLVKGANTFWLPNAGALRHHPEPMHRLLALTAFFASPERLAWLLRRPSMWMALLPVAVAVVWSMDTLGQPTPLMHLTEAPWETHETAELAFALPAHWTVTTTEDGSLRLAEQDVTGGAVITLAFAPEAPATMEAIEREGVRLIEQNPAIRRHFVRIDGRARLAGRAAARLQYTADLASGQRVDAIWMAVPIDDGRLLGLTLTVPEDAYFTAADALFRRFIQSVTLMP